MLTQYLTLTAALLQAPSSPVPLVSNAVLTTYINQSRQQVAGQGLCIRRYADLPLPAAGRQASFSAITGLGTGVAGVNDIRQMLVPSAAGLQWVSPRPFEYFTYFFLNNPVPPTGLPSDWSQFGQGQSGTVFVDPLPDQDYVAKVDVVGVPIDLVDDTTAEAIPPIWTLAVPFYSAWMAFLSLQRAADADAMLKRFEQQMALARNAANPNLLDENWSQAPSPIGMSQLGLQKAG